MDRRRFLAVLLGSWAAVGVARVAGAAAPPRGRAPGDAALPPKVRQALEAALHHVHAHCTSLAYPNGAVHGVRALGRSCPLGPGDPFRLLLEANVRTVVVRDRAFLEVPVANEGHRNAMLKTLLEKGCEPELEFRLEGRRYTFGDVIDSAVALCDYPGRMSIDEHSWTIMALALALPRDRVRWQNVFGGSVDIERMIDDTSQALWADTELVRTIDLEASALSRDCPALARACGGLHMLYALAVALANGRATPARTQAFAAHMRTLVLRMTYDLKIIDEVEALNVGIAGRESAAIVAFDARVKFLGHALEIVALADQHGLYALAPAERRRVDAARDVLCDVLVAGRSYDLARLRSQNAALFDSLATGLCHAYNGLASSPS